ncbi:MAG TPA: helix-turn-helix transcriptional regulator [Sphingomicrobium sp.]|nr:helix-turn-helix transcriptional regulator [Sphingomicrobium sp.]
MSETSTQDLPSGPGYTHPMTDGPYIAEAAALIGDPARANMLVALLGGQAMTATELGLAAHVAPSTASGHLAKLVDGKLLAVTASGRHRYYRLGSARIAQVLEELMALAGDGAARHRPKSRCDDDMARARTCYDHFAGKLGVALADGLAARNQIIMNDDGAILTEAGRSFLRLLGVSFEPPGRSRRALCRPCLDWSERRLHIGGSVGAAIAKRSFELGWTTRQANSRAVTVTASGIRAFDELFGVKL